MLIGGIVSRYITTTHYLIHISNVDMQPNHFDFLNPWVYNSHNPTQDVPQGLKV